MTTTSQDKITVPGDDRLTKLNVSTKTPFWTKIPIIKELRVAVGWQKGMLITGLAITAFFLLAAFFAPLIAPDGHAQIKAADGTSFPAQAAPSAEHIWGTTAAEWGYDLNRSVSDVTAGIWWTAVFPGIAIVLIVLGITLVGESLNDLADPRLRARKSAGEVVGSIEDTSVDPNEKPSARNEVIAELDANVDPPATVTDHDPTIVASEWTGEGKPEGKE